MTDMSAVIIAKSDQINADDLVGGPRTIRVAGVKISPDAEQPVSISIEGDKKVWRPCKTMSRVLVAAWGPDAKQYTGKTVTLYRDPKVKWGGLEVGGIRISHMSDIDPKKVSDGKMTVTLKESRNHSRPAIIKLLSEQPPAPASDPAAKYAADYIDRLEKTTVADALESLVTRQAGKLEQLRKARPDLAQTVDLAIVQHRQRLGGQGDDAFAGDFTEGPADSDRGETPTLDEAKAAIDRAELVADVNNLVRTYQGQLSDEDHAEPQSHALGRVETLTAK